MLTGVCDEGGERRRAFDDDDNEMGPLVCTTLAVYDDGAQRRSRFGGVGRRRFQRVDRCTTTVMTMNGGQCTMIGAITHRLAVRRRGRPPEALHGRILGPGPVCDTH